MSEHPSDALRQDARTLCERIGCTYVSLNLGGVLTIIDRRGDYVVLTFPVWSAMLAVAND